MTEEATETLKLLGLTQVQAKVYLTLLRTESSRIKELAQLSRVPRPDVYRIINDLEKKGLVEKEIAAPLKFKAIPLRECVETLLQHRNRESDEIKKKAKELLKYQSDRIEEGFSLSSDSHFFLIPSGRVVKRLGQAMETVQKSVDLIITFNRLFQGLRFLSDLNLKALARKVRIRWVVEKPIRDLAKSIDFLGHPLFEIKYSLFEPTVILGIYDDKEVSIATNPETDLKDSPLLWSDNNALVALAKDYFEKSWLIGQSFSDHH